MGESGVIKSVVIFLLLAVFSLVAGSMVADSAKEAIIPALLVAGIAALIYLGKNCWWLIFIAPPVISAFGFMPGIPVAYGFCGIILLYWILMTCLGYTRMTWNGVKGLDIATLVLFLFFLSTWVRNPVTIDYFTSIYDEGYANLGGKAYVWCLASILFYITLSVIPLKVENVIKALRIAFWISFVIGLLFAIKSIITPTPQVSAVEPAENLRSSPLIGSGVALAQFLFAKYAIVGIIFSPWKVFLIIASFAAVAKSGFRSEVMKLLIYAGIANYVHKKLMLSLIFLVCAWGMVVTMSHARVFDDMPFGVQRSLSAVPGIQLNDEKAVSNANATMNWRYRLWDMGWNPKSGYIKDYVWGDGFALSQEFLKKQSVLTNRGEWGYGDFHGFAISGLWHHGTLAVVHRTGYVGVIVLGGWFLLFAITSLRLCMYIREISGREYIYIHAISFIMLSIVFFWTPCEWLHVFAFMVYDAVIVKLAYTLVIKKGMMPPMFSRKVYVPLMYRLPG